MYFMYNVKYNRNRQISAECNKSYVQVQFDKENQEFNIQFYLIAKYCR